MNILRELVWLGMFFAIGGALGTLYRAHRRRIQRQWEDYKAGRTIYP